MSQSSNISRLHVATTMMTTVAPDYCDVTDETASLLVPVVYSVVFCLGLPGNVLALAVLLQRGRGYAVKPAMRVYLLNLALADVLFSLPLPAWAVYYAHREDWPLCESLCRLLGALYYSTTYSAVSFLTLIAVNRYRTLTLTPPRLPMLKGRGAWCVCACTWLFWLACAVPSLATPQMRRDAGVGGGAGRERCFRDVDPRWALAAVGFSVLAFLAVLTSYLSILGSLGVAPSRQGLHRRQAAIAVATTLLVFLACVLPYHVTLALWAGLGSGPRPPCPSLVHRVSTVLFSATCCLDPLVYCFSLRRFRKQARSLLWGGSTPSLLPRLQSRTKQGSVLASEPKDTRTFSS